MNSLSSESRSESGSKLSYHFDIPDSEDCIIKEEVRDVIKFANLYKYIERFSLSKYREDANFMKEFIMTHTMFTSTLELYRIVRERYLGPQEEGISEEQKKVFQKEGQSIRSNILRFVRKWIRRIDYLDEETYGNLSSFIFTCVSEKSTTIQSKDDLFSQPASSNSTPVEEKRGSLGDRKLTKTSSLTADAFASRKKLIDLLNKKKKMDLESFEIPKRNNSNIDAGSIQDLSVEDFVKQTTLLELSYFQKLKVSEFLGQVH